MTSRRARGTAPWLLALAGYTSLAIAISWPLVMRVSSALPHDAGDPLLTSWILWWNAHARPLSTEWWNAPIFWPLPGALALSEHFLGASLVASPLQWLGADAVTAYNVVFLLSFPLAAVAAHALAYELTGRHDAAAIAGLAFGFNPYRASQISHLQMLWVFWMPVALVALHRYARDPRARWLLLFAIAWVGEALSNTYLLLFFPLLLALWVGWFLVRRGAGKRAAAVAAAWTVGACALLPIALQYYRLGQRFAVERTSGEIREFSATFAAFLSVPPLSPASAILPVSGNAEQHLFPGFAIVLLIVAAAIVSLSRGLGAGYARHRATKVLAAMSAGALVVAGLSPVVGAWHVNVAGWRLIGVASPQKPLTVALWCAVLAACSGARVARAWCARSAFAFYVGAASAMYMLSLGPDPAAGGVPIWYFPPYAWLLELAGFSSVRAPARVAIVGVLCLSIAAAIAFDRLCARVRPRARTALAAIAIAAVVADGWMRPLPMADLPQRWSVKDAPRDHAVLELPLGSVVGDLGAMYRAMDHGSPVVNGYSGFEPVHYRILRDALAGGDTDALAGLARHAPLLVVNGEHATVFGPLRFDDERRDEPIGVRSVDVDGNAVDGQTLSTAPGAGWSVGAVQPSGVVTIDLGSVREVSAIVLRLGVHILEYPRELAIETSTDARAWRTAWAGHCAGRAVAGALDDPAAVPLTFAFAPSAARWVRLRQLGRDRQARWTFAALTVRGR